jgi:hypothetical protein
LELLSDVDLTMLYHKFVFIGGLHRSGTSILHECLREHPQASGFRDTGVPEDEGQHLQSVYPPAKDFGGPGKFGFYSEAYLTESSPLVSDANRQRLLLEWKRHWNLKRPILLEKSPPNLIRMRFLQAMFPGCFFIMMIRHPIAVSYATQKWSNTTLHSLVKHWLLCHEAMERDREKIENLFVLKYEDFVADPDGHLGRLYSFLGIDQQPCRLDVEDANPKYFHCWTKARRKLISRYVASRFEKRINHFGYTFNHLADNVLVKALG